MSTQTEGCFSRKSSGSSVYGIRWNHISFMGFSFRPSYPSRAAVRYSVLDQKEGKGVGRPPPPPTFAELCRCLSQKSGKRLYRHHRIQRLNRENPAISITDDWA